MRITAVGYGAGTMDLETPNVLRLFVGEASGAPGPAPVETIVQVETTVDDMSPQLYEPLLERLLEAGALDVWLTPRDHEAQPAGGGPDRALRAGAGRRPLTPALRGVLDHRRPLDRVPARPPRARDGPARHRARTRDLQGLPARGPGGHGQRPNSRKCAASRATEAFRSGRCSSRRTSRAVASSPPLDTVPRPGIRLGALSRPRTLITQEVAR